VFFLPRDDMNGRLGESVFQVGLGGMQAPTQPAFRLMCEVKAVAVKEGGKVSFYAARENI